MCACVMVVVVCVRYDCLSVCFCVSICVRFPVVKSALLMATTLCDCCACVVCVAHTGFCCCMASSL